MSADNSTRFLAHLDIYESFWRDTNQDAIINEVSIERRNGSDISLESLMNFARLECPGKVE